MAFVFEAERFKKEIENDDQFYLEHKQYIIKKSKVPFNTTQKRSKQFNKNKRTKQQILFENFHRLLDKKKQLIYEHLKQLKKPKQKQYQQTNNFQIRKSQSVEIHQILNKELSPKRNKRNFKVPKITKKILNHPTIPNEGNLNMKQMQIIENKEKQNKQEKQFQIPTNPFYYGKEDNFPEVDFMQGQNIQNTIKNIIPWRQQIKKTKSLQPKKQYSDQQFYVHKENQPLYKLKQSSFFQSKVPKTQLHFDNILNSQYKKQKKISNDVYLKENIPGPGYYHSEKDDEIKQKNQAHQFFNSSAPRFQIINQQIQVDAGLYNHKSHFEQKNINHNSKYGNLSFQTFTKKFLNIQEKENLDIPFKIKHGNFDKKTFNSKNYFINKNDRFEYQKIPTTHTQKAQLQEQKYINEHQDYLEAKDRILEPLQRKEVPFNIGEQRLKEDRNENLPFTGYYDVENDNIRQKLEKLLENQYKKEDYKKIYFESKQQRWEQPKQKKKSKKEKYDRVFKDIPQYYYVPEILNPTKVPFQSTDKRFKKTINDNKDCDLSGTVRPDWEIKSFNIKYQLLQIQIYQ